MLKLLIALFFVISLISCSSINKKKYIYKKADVFEIIDVLNEAEKIKDSLKINGVEEVIILHQGCNGCVSGVPQNTYIFWNQEEYIKVKRINTYKYYSEEMMTNNIFSFYALNREKINSELLIPPDIELLHYNFTTVRFYLNGKIQSQIEVSDFYRTIENSNKKVLMWIYLIESNLFRTFQYNNFLKM